MTQEFPRLTPDELAELDRYLNSPRIPTPPPEPTGPLPPVESDNPERVDARWREFAEGKGPRTGRRSRWSARALKRAEAGSAVIDVFCGSRLIARACNKGGALFIITEMKQVGPGVSFTWFALTEQPRVAVKCRGHEHVIRSAALAEHARRVVPGKPRAVGVALVAEG